MGVFRLELTGVPDRHSLVHYLARQFMFPHEVVGVDAAVDLMSDLEWFGNSNGYLVVAHGLTDGSEVANAFVSMLPNVVDRWRSQAVPFVVAIDSLGSQLQAALDAANQEMARAGQLPWAQPGTGSVDVIVHGGKGSGNGE
jgi:S-ribosylhomocysteine lyase LuxS involved in autoinducer biosynthesis